MQSASVRMNWTTGGMVLVAFVPILATALVGLGLVGLAVGLGGVLATIAAFASSIIGLVVAAVLMGALIAYLELQVPREIERAIERQIRAANLTPTLNESPLLIDAGEGLAEALAVRILGAEADSVRENRVAADQWGLVHVTERECRVMRATRPGG